MRIITRRTIIIIFVSFIALLISYHGISIKIKHDRQYVNYQKETESGIEFLRTSNIDLYLFGNGSDLVNESNVNEKALPFGFYVNFNEVGCTNNGVWYEMEDRENNLLVFQSFDGNILHKIDISPLNAIESVCASGDGRYVAYSGWHNVGLSDMSCDYIYIYNLQTNEKRLLFKEDEKSTLWSIKLSHDGKILYYVQAGRVCSLDVDSGRVCDIIKGREVFSFDDHNIGVIVCDDDAKFFKINMQDSTRELVFQKKYLDYAVYWDSTGRYISYLEPINWGSFDQRKHKKEPHVFDIESVKLYRFPHGYYGDLIYIAAKSVDDESGGMTVWAIE